jgi:hypothetical protein
MRHTPMMNHALDLGDAFLHPLAGAFEGRADEKEFDRAVLNTLALAHLVAQMKRRTASGPKAFLQHSEVLREFVVSEGHGGLLVRMGFGTLSALRLLRLPRCGA